MLMKSNQELLQEMRDLIQTEVQNQSYSFDIKYYEIDHDKKIIKVINKDTDFSLLMNLLISNNDLSVGVIYDLYLGDNKLGRLVRPNPDGKVQYTPIAPMKYVSIDVVLDKDDNPGYDTKVLDKPEYYRGNDT